MRPNFILSQEERERFWSFVDRSGGPDACWPWLRGFSSSGYGQYYWLTEDGRRHSITSNRAAYLAHHGELPPDPLCILHTCDYRPCCNPGHLWDGDRAANNRDMWGKGRGRHGGQFGEAHYKTTLTEADIRHIRATYRRGLGVVLARQYNVSPVTISAVVHRRNWKHVA